MKMTWNHAAGAPAGKVTAPADYSLWGIILANVLVLVIALTQDWPLAVLLWPYWIQSIVIGLYNTRRILALDEYTTDGFYINNRPVDPTPATKLQVAGFFVLHYGIFHAVYFGFLLTITPDAGIDWYWMAILAVAFMLSHGFSHFEHIRYDLEGGTNIGNLMFMPYLRVIPMHLTIIFGMGALEGGAGALVLFTVLKTVADIAMHRVEHYLMHKSGAPDPADPSGSA